MIQKSLRFDRHDAMRFVMTGCMFLLCLAHYNTRATTTPTPVPSVQAEGMALNTENISLQTETLAGEANTLSPATPNKPTCMLDFENASLSTIVSFLAEKRNVTIVPNKSLDSVFVSLHTRNELTEDDAWETLYTLLDINGFTLVQTVIEGKETLYRIISTKEDQRNALPTFSSSNGFPPESLRDTDEHIRYVYFCKNMKARSATSILERLLAPQSIYTNNALEACVITEKSRLIKSALALITELDQGGLREAITILPLKHGNATAIASLFSQGIFTSPQQRQRILRPGGVGAQDFSYFSSDTRIIPEPIKNQLIILGTNDALEKLTSFIQKYIDIPLTGAQSRLHIKELMYFSAEHMKSLLDRLIQAPRSNQAIVEGEFRYFEDVIIAAESASEQAGSSSGGGNRLVISCSNEDWNRLNAFIDNLDKPSPQVAIECMIVDLSRDIERSLGIDIRGASGIINPEVGFMTSNLAAQKGITNINNRDMGTTVEGLSGKSSSMLTIGDAAQKNIWGVLQAIQQNNSSNIIAQPFLVTNNNMPAVEEVIFSKWVDGTLSSQGSNSMSYQNREEVKAIIRTSITPRINAAGVIDLQIDFTVSEFSEVTNSSPDKTQRTLKTRAMMSVGEVLVVGGLASTKASNSKWHMPGLSSIPLLGNLFKNASHNDTERHLYIFIRPSIISPMFDSTADDYTQFKVDYAKLQMSKNNPFATTDPIQHWFFNNGKESIKQRLADIAEQNIPSVDDFVSHRDLPKQVAIAQDQYFTTEAKALKTENDASREGRMPYPDAPASLSMPSLEPSSPALLRRSIDRTLARQDLFDFEAGLDKLERRRTA